MEDARHRTKVWLDTYITPANLTRDDDSTLLKYVVVYANPDYPLEREFIDNRMDIIFSVEESEGKPLLTNEGVPHSWVENVPITVHCISKPGITGVKSQRKAVEELRAVAQAYPEGSKRVIDVVSKDTVVLGATKIYQTKIILRYRRAVTVSGTPTLTYGHGKLEECQTAYTTRGDSGDALTTPSCTVQHDSFFRIEGTTDNVAAVEYCYYQSADLTSESVSTTIYDKWLLRFKTSVSSLGLGAKVEIVYTDDATEVLYGSTPEYSTSWKVVSGSITANKVLKYIRFYASEDAADNANGTYYVEYDFLLIHSGTFTFPYVSKPLELDVTNREAIHKVPGRVGVRTQYLGMNSPLIVLSGDMDNNSDWGSPLGQVLYEIVFERHDDPWQWFNSDLIDCKVEVVSFKIKQSSEDDAKRQWVLTLRKLDEYSGDNDWVWEYFSP